MKYKLISITINNKFLLQNLALNRLLLHLKTRSYETYIHSLRVSNISRALCKEMGINHEKTEKIVLAGMFHDVGKLFIPKTLINSKRILTNQEYEIIKKHTILGAGFLSRMIAPHDVVIGALRHHERLDGSGYPFGLRERELGLTERILAIADSFDTIVSKRSYKEGIPYSLAVRDILFIAGKKYDKDVAYALATLNVKDEL